MDGFHPAMYPGIPQSMDSFSWCCVSHKHSLSLTWQDIWQECQCGSCFDDCKVLQLSKFRGLIFVLVYGIDRILTTLFPFPFTPSIRLTLAWILCNSVARFVFQCLSLCVLRDVWDYNHCFAGFFEPFVSFIFPRSLHFSFAYISHSCGSSVLKG